MKDRIILEGNLEAIMLPDVLTFVSMIKKTGRLELHVDEIEKTFFLKRGEIVFAHSTDRDESLGRFLLRNGKITKEQYQESINALKPGVRHGKLLVKLGYITPKDLWWGVKNQVLDIIYSTFSWSKGTFLFYEMPESMIKLSIVIGTSTTSLIMEGIRRLDEWARINEKIPSKEMEISRMDVSPEYLDSLGFSSMELILYEQIRDAMTVQEVIRSCKLSEFDASRILLTLLMAKVIIIRDPLGRKEAETEDMEILDKIIAGYGELFQGIFMDLVEAIGLESTGELFAQVLENQQTTSTIFLDISFNSSGKFDGGTLLSNVADLSVDERTLVLDDALNTLLSYLLFEVTQHLTPEKKETLYLDVSEQKARLDEIFNIDDLLT